jgi:hypothetical protein
MMVTERVRSSLHPGQRKNATGSNYNCVTLDSEELHELYSSPNVITAMKSRRITWAEHVGRMGEMRNAYTLLIETPESKRQFWRHWRSCENNTKKEFQGNTV